MNRLILLSLLCGALSPMVLAAEPAPPNVVIFLSDDQGWGDLSVHGNTQLSTPNIDSLAHDGARFDRFFVCPVCSPTRAEFLTGRYHPRGGVSGVSTGQERLDLDEKTIADAFRAAGYATGAFGKWHNGSQWPYHPNARGFEEYFGFTSGHWGEYFNPPLEHNGESIRSDGYIADIFTDQALAFIDEHQSQPFFCYVPFNTPHSPWAVPGEYWKRHHDQPITMRGSDGDRETLDITRCALAMCENLDDNVGRVLKRLDDLKLADNTIVIYFTDNGPNSFRWNDGMKGRKGTTDEGGVRVPCLIRWPKKIPAGQKIPQIAGAIDLYPTLANLAGVKPVTAGPFDGRDLSPLLQGALTDWPDREIVSHWAGKVSVRSQQYRLDDRGALYDMQADPGQTRDVQAERPDVAKQLSTVRESWMRDVLGRKDTVATTEPKKKKGKGKESAAESSDTARPFTVGYAEFPMTPLPARDGIPHGGVQRSAAAPNCSYFVNWTQLDDSITWDIEVHTAGEYDVEVHYTCPEVDAGSTIELRFGEHATTAKVPSWDPPLYTNQDTIPRPPGESTMKEFLPLSMGTMRLEKGRGQLVLQAREIPGKTVMDVRLVKLTLKTDGQEKASP